MRCCIPYLTRAHTHAQTRVSIPVVVALMLIFLIVYYLRLYDTVTLTVEPSLVAVAGIPCVLTGQGFRVQRSNDSEQAVYAYKNTITKIRIRTHIKELYIVLACVLTGQGFHGAPPIMNKWYKHTYRHLIVRRGGRYIFVRVHNTKV